MPSYLNNLLPVVRNSEIHNQATRHSNISLMCPKDKRKSEGPHVFKSFLAEQKAAMCLRP